MLNPEKHNESPRNITAFELNEDNKSKLAQSRLADWYRAKNEKKLVGLFTCSDARVSIGGSTTRALLTGRTIAGQVSKEYRFMLGHPAVQFNVVAPHFRGDIWEMGTRPTGCGGEDAKAQFVENPQTHIDPLLDRYIDTISHENPFNQAIANAYEIAKMSKKETAATVLDHMTGMLYCIALFNANGEITYNAYKQKSVMMPVNSNAGIYVVPPNEMPSHMEDFFQEIEMESKRRLQGLTPPLPTQQEIQDPQVIYVTTAPIPLSRRMPGHFLLPNTAFHVRLAKSKVGRETMITEEAILLAFQQAIYPIIQNMDKRGHGFKSTKTIVIETPVFDVSRKVAKDFRGIPLVREWEQSGGRILISQVRQGNIVRIEDFE